jgi:hypothetical protein
VVKAADGRKVLVSASTPGVQEDMAAVLRLKKEADAKLKAKAKAEKEETETPAVAVKAASGDVPLAYTTCGEDHLGIKSVTASEFPGERGSQEA